MLDKVFPPDECDEEVGAAFERDGLAGVHRVRENRNPDQLVMLPPGEAYHAAIMAAYWMGQDV
jgi:hypothetical protein